MIPSPARIKFVCADQLAPNVTEGQRVNDFNRAVVVDPRGGRRRTERQSAAISASLVAVFQFRTVTAVPSRLSQLTLLNVAFRLPFGHHRYR